MKSKTIIGVALALAASSVSASSDRSHISGSFWENGATRAYFDLKVAAGETQKLPLFGGRVIEVSRSDSGDSNLRLLDSQGRELYAANLGNDTADKSVRLAMCANGVEFSNPAIEEQVACTTR